MDRIHRNYAENSMEPNETYEEYAERMKAKELFRKRRTIFWYFWNYALPHYMPGKWDNRNIDTWVETEGRMLYLIHYMLWFLSYEAPKTVSRMADVIDSYDYNKLSMEGFKWKLVEQRRQAVVSDMQKNNPKLHKYLMTLPGFASIMDRPQP